MELFSTPIDELAIFLIGCVVGYLISKWSDGPTPKL